MTVDGLIREGAWFLVPIDRAQFGVGLVIRAPRRGGVLLGTFFGPRLTARPTEEWLRARKPAQAAFLGRFRDRSIRSGEWPILWTMDNFDRRHWPLPPFHRFDGSVTATPGATAIYDWQVQYSDDNLITPVAEFPAKAQDKQLPPDIVYEPRSLVLEMSAILTAAIPSADDGQWR